MRVSERKKEGEREREREREDKERTDSPCEDSPTDPVSRDRVLPIRFTLKLSPPSSAAVAATAAAIDASMEPPPILLLFEVPPIKLPSKYTELDPP